MLRKEHAIVLMAWAQFVCSSQELEAVTQSKQGQGFLAQVTGLVNLSVSRDRENKNLMGEKCKRHSIFFYPKNLYMGRSLCQRL